MTAAPVPAAAPLPAHAAPPRARWQRVLLGNEPALQRPLRFSLMVMGLYGVWIAILGGLLLRGDGPRPLLAGLLALDLAAALGFYLLIRSGWTLRHAAIPSLAWEQVLVGYAAISLKYALLPAARPMMLQLLCVGQMFALFNLPPRRTWQAGMLAALLLVACRLGAAAAGGEPLAPAVRELVIPVAVLLLMAWTTRRHALTRAQLRERRTALAEAAGRLQALVNCDALTGLPNRAALQQRLDALCASPAAADQPWCLALIDLDHFKQVNDQAGHAAGDEVLCRFAALAGGLLRADDVLARWGGEEFLLLLPAADAAAATHGVERLRERLAQQPLLPTRPTLRVTLSAGVAEHRAGDSWASTLAQADVALYAAKAGGRNRVRLAQGWPAL